jgi:hypothetical protein
MYAAGNDACRAQGILEVESRLVVGLTRICRKEIRDSSAAIGLILLVSEFQPGVHLNTEVRIVSEQSFVICRLSGLPLLGIFGDEGLRRAGGEALCRNLAPDGFENRTTVQLEGSGASRLDLGLGLPVQGSVGASLDGRELKWEGIPPDPNTQA